MDEVGPGTFGAALGTTGHITDAILSTTCMKLIHTQLMMEHSATPLVYVKEAAAADETGVMVKTSFSF